MPYRKSCLGSASCKCIYCTAKKVNESSLAGRIAGTETSVKSLTKRVTTLELKTSDHASRIAAIESELSEVCEDVENSPFIVVTSEAELAAALQTGNAIWIDVPIEITLPVGTNYHVNSNTWITGRKGHAKLYREHVAGERVDVLELRGSNITIENIEFTTNHPLTNDRPNGLKFDADCGIFFGTGNYSLSNILIRNCYFHHLGNPINGFSSGTSRAQSSRNIRIVDCVIHSFIRCGIQLYNSISNLHLVRNDIRGRVDSDTHLVYSNGVYLYNIDDVFISHVAVRNVDRNGYEYFNPSIPGGNARLFCHHCIAEDIGENSALTSAEEGGDDAGFGFSLFGAVFTHLDDCVAINCDGIGFEIFNNATSLSQLNVFDCYALNCVDIGMTLNGIKNAKISGVVIENVTVPAGSASGTFAKGIMLINTGRDIQITDCKFKNAGAVNIYLVGNGTDLFTAIDISGNTFHWTTDRDLGAGVTFAHSVNLYRPLGKLTVRNNTSWADLTTNPNDGIFILDHAGTVYYGPEVADVVVRAGVGQDIITGTNLRLSYV